MDTVVYDLGGGDVIRLCWGADSDSIQITSQIADDDGIETGRGGMRHARVGIGTLYQSLKSHDTGNMVFTPSYATLIARVAATADVKQLNLRELDDFSSGIEGMKALIANQARTIITLKAQIGAGYFNHDIMDIFNTPEYHAAVSDAVQTLSNTYL